MTAPQPISRSTGDIIREHQLSLGAAVMDSDSIAQHVSKAFGNTTAPAAETFALVPEETLVGKQLSKRKKKDTPASKETVRPTSLVEYQVTLEGGTQVTIPEYAHLVRLDGETLILGFPISSSARFKPQRGSNLLITSKAGSLNCFCAGIHSDIPEWGVSLSIYLIIP